LDEDNEIHAWATDGLQPQGHQVTPKAALSKGNITQRSHTKYRNIKYHTEKWHKKKRKDH
jgi:hypothetical protein